MKGGGNMGYLRIYCDYCSGTWEVYRKDTSAASCPHCSKRINARTWEHEIIHAWNALEKANKELIKDSIGYENPLFVVDFIADTVFENSKKEKKA